MSRRKKCVFAFWVALIFVVFQSESNGQINANWLSGSGNWSDVMMWDIAVVPNNSPPDFYHAAIDSRSMDPSVVTIQSSDSFAIDRLSIAKGGELIVEANGILQIVQDDARPMSGVMDNAGTLFIDSTTGPGFAKLRLEAPVVLQGGGSINMTGDNTFVMDDFSLVEGALINVDNVIQGSGFLGNGRLQLTNHVAGLIDANIDRESLTIRSRPDVDFVNDGTLQASMGGTLVLSGHQGILDNTAGVIQALSDSSVELTFLVSISGGVVEGVAGGLVKVPEANNVSIADATIDNICVQNNASLALDGMINNGLLVVNGTGPQQSRIFIHGETTLNGDGNIALNGPGARLIDFSANAGHLINVNNTIVGQGNIGGGQMRLTNQSSGVIEANVDGQELTINTRNGEDLINAGIMRACGGATLAIRGFTGILDNTDGQIIAADASQVVIPATPGPVIVGGTLRAEGSGHFSTDEFATVQLVDLILDAPFTIGGNSNLILAGNIQNQVINVDASVAPSSNLLFTTDATLNGDNVINMIGAGARIWTPSGAANDGHFNNVNNIIRGQGSLGLGTMQLSNQQDGVISADVSGETMTLSTIGGHDLVNSGLIEATNGGVLHILGFPGVLNNRGGTICAQAGSVIELRNNLVISDGTLTTMDDGQLLVPSAQSATFNDVTAEGEIDVQGNLTLTGTLDNQALLQFASPGLVRIISVPAAITGKGELNLGDSGTQIVPGTSNNNGLDFEGGKLSGVGRLNVDTRFYGDALLAPGNSIGSILFDANRTYQFVDGATIEIEMNSTAGSPGINWDFIDVVNGTLDFDDDILPSAAMIKLVTVDGAGDVGPLSKFDPNVDFSIPIAQAHTVNGFDTNNFTVDTSAFANAAPGTFCVALDENTLFVNYFALLLGDLNGDCLVSLLDVQPFVAAIATGTFIPQADINQDGFVNLLDVGPFVALLSSG